MPQVAVIVGSLRLESINRRLARALAKLAEPRLDLQLVELNDVPLYNEDLWADPPPAVLQFKREVAAADAVLFVTPEYNRGLPAVTKNAVDWGSRPVGHSVWSGKPGAIAGATPGAVGTAVAQSQLRPILVACGVALMGQPELYLTFKPDMVTEDFDVPDPKTRDFLLGFLTKFEAWIARFPRQG